ncbi:MAG: AraC family transcriptional regulator [Clostridiales bacterium]|nr:AraC family transcriptional regulator [Clostridiales bacterium]
MEKMFTSEGVTKSDRILHTPGTFAKNHLLYVQEVGKLQSLVPHICRRENLDSYLIFEVVEGRGSITAEGTTFELQRGDCVWIDCQEPFEHVSSEEEPWKLVWVHFNGNCAAEFYRLFRKKNESPILPPRDSVKVADMLERLLEGLKGNMSELELHSLLTQLVTGCLLETNEKNRMEEVREFINVNYRDAGIYKLLAERFGMEQSILEQQFGESYGINVRDYILNRRFNMAKELLRFTIRPMDEVMEASGIGNEDLFYQLFRENEGVTPEEYRKNWAQWIKD